MNVNSKKLNPLILKCGIPNSISFSSIDGAITTRTANSITSLTVNSSCFHNPCLRLEFTSNIIVPATTANVTLVFQIFKICTNMSQPIPVGTPWTFMTSATTSDTFSFFVCDCDICSDECCTYTVQVTATTQANEGDNTSVSVNYATLSALLVDNKDTTC